MKNAITTILTDPSARGSVAIEKTLTQQAQVMSPWAD